MYDIFILDLGNNKENIEKLVNRFPFAKTVRYYNDHLQTIRRCVTRAKTKFVWVISSCCDYSDFDFGYKPPPWEAYQIHCWASGQQQFGDTFLIPVDEFKKQFDIELLEYYKDINYHTLGVQRLPWPIETITDNLPDRIKNYTFHSIYALFTNKRCDIKADMCLWRNEIFKLNTSGSIALIPNKIKQYLDTKVYDYPHINFQFVDKTLDQCSDIFYISNGEPREKLYYDIACDKIGKKINWIKGINNRTNAIKEAASQSNTEWLFVIGAKLEISENFDWDWQPDYFQKSEHYIKHYIFDALNPVNGLRYGHMALVAYNKNLALATNKPGLDFTLSQPHTVVPMLSGIAHFNQSPITTWRTAFREVVKLSYYQSISPTSETKFRLSTWCEKAVGDYAEWSLQGAQDAIEYYRLINGQLDKLELTYTWQWLDEYVKSKGYNIC